MRHSSLGHAMAPHASSSAASTQLVPSSPQRRQVSSHAPVQHTRLPSAVGKHEPSPQSSLVSHACPAERRQPPWARLQPSAPHSVAVSQTVSAQTWNVAPVQRVWPSSHGVAGAHALPSGEHTSFGPHAAAQHTLSPPSVATQLPLEQSSARVQASPASSRQPSSSHSHAAPSRAAGFQENSQSPALAQAPPSLQVPAGSRSA